MFRKYIFKVLAFCFGLAAIFFLFNSLDQTSSREDYAKFINNHKYALNRYDITPDKYGITPDKAYEQDYLRTLDPSTGKPEPTRLNAIYKQVNQKLAKASAVPGSSSNTTWVERGPDNVAGRTRALMFDPNASSGNKVWAGGVTGGLWYNNDITNSNSSWVKVNDFWDNISISAIAYDPNNTQIFYVGTGEVYAGASRGGGIWKSTDGGNTWNKLVSTNGYYYVNDIVVRNESGSSVVYAAVDGRFYKGAFHGSANAGLQRSTNGGTSWTQVLPNIPSESINFVASDLELAADNRIWIGTKASPYGANDQGGGRILYSDNGTSWTTSRASNVTNGDGRVEVACAPSNANYVYALVEDQGEVFEILKTTNKGSAWSVMPEPNDDDNGIPASDFTRGQAWYDLIIAVDPNDANKVIAGGINLHMSTNGATNWSQISKWSNNPNMGSKNYSYVHADQHQIVFKPGQSSEVIFGTDGGVFYTSSLSSAPTTDVISSRNKDYNVTQFYACAIHPTQNQNYFLAGAQDNGSHAFSSVGMNSTVEVNGGDGAFCFIDQTNPNYQITSYVYNTYDLSTNGGSSFFTNIVSDQNTGSFINVADYDNNLDILFSAKGTSDIWRFNGITGSINQSSVLISGMQTMASAMYVSPHTTSSTTLFVGCEDGSLFKVTNANGASSSTNITGSGFPNGSISCIDLGATENEIIVTFFNYGVSSVWYSANGGTTWSNKEGNLPDMPVRWAMFNPTNYDEVILATEVGIWGTDNFSSPLPTWSSSNSGLANVRVDMLQMRTSDYEVIAATHGRGLFSSSGFNFTASTSPPVAGIQINQNSICTADSIQLTDASTNFPSTWFWTVSGAGIQQTSTKQNPKFAFSQGGYYDIKLVASNSFGTDSTTTQNAFLVGTNPVEITIKTDNYGSETTWALYDNSGNVINQGGPYTDVINGQTFTINECLPNGCYKFKIFDSFGDGICCANGNGFYQIKSLTNNIITNTGGSFTTADSANFCVPPTGAPPIADFNYSSNTICAGDTVFFTDASANIPTSWHWSFIGGVANDTSISNPYVVYNSPGTYSVTLLVQNASGNDAEFKSNIIIVQPGPAVSVNLPSGYCDNENFLVGITASTYTGTWSVSWDANMVDTAFFNPNKLGVGTYSGSYTITGSNGCKGTQNFSFDIKNAPQVVLNFTDTLCVGAQSFSLSGGVPVGGTYSGLGITNGVFEPAGVGSGIYALKYVYNDPNGCSDSAYSNLVIDVCQGISGTALKSMINVYPNPVKDELYVNLNSVNESVELNLINTIGEVVKTEVINQGVNYHLLKTDDLAKGVYFLTMKIKTEVISYRIVKTE